MTQTGVVLACFGDAASIDAIAEWSTRAAVVAVAFDFGGASSLHAVRDAALAAGALRCHAFDVRDAFARELIRLGLQSGDVPPDAAAATARAAMVVVERTLQDVAGVEGAVVALPERIPAPVRGRAKPEIPPVHLDIRFEHGLPIAINGVEMTLTELLESIETITGEPALTVLQQHRPGIAPAVVA